MHPGPLPEHYRYLNTAPTRKHKNKHKKHKHKDGTMPQETSLMGKIQSNIQLFNSCLSFFVCSFVALLNTLQIQALILTKRNIKNRNVMKTTKNEENVRKKRKGKNNDTVLNIRAVLIHSNLQCFSFFFFFLLLHLYNFHLFIFSFRSFIIFFNLISSFKGNKKKFIIFYFIILFNFFVGKKKRTNKHI